MMRCPNCKKPIPEEEDNYCPFCEEEASFETEYDGGFSLMEQEGALAEKEDLEEDIYEGSLVESVDKIINKIIKAHPEFCYVDYSSEELTPGQWKFEYKFENEENGKEIKIIIETTPEGKVEFPKGYFIISSDGEEQMVEFKNKKNTNHKRGRK